MRAHQTDALLAMQLQPMRLAICRRVRSTDLRAVAIQT